MTDLCFCNLTTARHRLTTLYELRVLDRFRPFRPVGSDPYHYHYLLDTIGVEVVVADRGIEVPRPGLHHSRALALADSQRLAHLLGVNDLFVRLVAAGRHDPDAELVTWWGERYCKTNLGEVVRPDGVGVWREGDATVTFCLEYDRGTEPLGRISAKAGDYERLERAWGIAFWLLVVVSSPRRERGVRAALAGSGLAVAKPLPGPASWRRRAPCGRPSTPKGPGCAWPSWPAGPDRPS
ncbi:MAG TPA: replication-relaxation family protein [Acidimicrobiales bacterium]|nr:replication-relaxation family protein [Acidimicrobiales bacterium]